MKRRLLIAAIPLAFVALVLAAWALDAAAHGGEPLRNVEVAGRDVGGLDEEALRAAVEQIAADYAEGEIVVATGDGELELTAADIGLAVDVDATVERALDEGRHDLLPMRPVRWLRSLLGSREAGVAAEVDRSMVRAVVAAEDPTPARDEPIEFGITGSDGEIAVVLGESGKGLDPDEVADAIEDALDRGDDPVVVSVEPGTIEPRFTKADAEALAEEARSLTDEPLTVTAGEATADIPGSTVRSWLRSTAGDDGLELALDDDRVLDDLETLLADAAVEPEDASFSVEGSKPVILQGVQGRSCCEPSAVGYVLGAIKAGHGGPVDLPMRTVDPDHTSEELEGLGIVEQIGTFTTPHKCCESRVTNIHRIADIVRGYVIPPGARFSVNEFVGKRTTDNGFVVGGVIENGTFAESVGGGVSQFATTTFNAAFFGGLDLVEYQSHSIYISRYPYGREATLSWPKPDLVVGNPSPYGVLIWPTYTNTSLTVTLYSTRYATGEQTGQSETPVGVAGCKRVTTQRTRTYVDGRTEVDRVFAVYRPAEGVQCDGPPPTTTTTTTAPPPDGTTTTTTTTTSQPPGG